MAEEKQEQKEYWPNFLVGPKNTKHVEGGVSKNGTEYDGFYEFKVPHGVELNGEKIGSCKFTVPEKFVKESKKFEGSVNVSLPPDWDINFKRDYKDQETGEFKTFEIKATMEQYREALDVRNEANKKYREEKKDYKAPERDAIASSKDAAEIGSKEVAKAQDAR